MSENQSPSSDSQDHTPEMQPAIPSQSNAANIDNLPASQTAPSHPEQIALALDPAASDEADLWETVSLPGTLDAQISSASAQREAQRKAQHKIDPREGELLQLIHDLNECNDALLSKVSQLEGALAQSQATLAAEAKKASALQGQMAQQVSAEQALAQQSAQTAQQQVAKLVGDLDNTEQALKRQQLINETLQTELTNAQERTIQLERECALIAQQHSSEAQARTKAENTARDLRSRLQRQQRYTLQFKAALEKSLSVTARPAQSAEKIQPFAFSEAPSVTMPKAQRIMPWASATSSAPFGGIDPNLEALIRGSNRATGELESTAEVAAAPTTLAANTAPVVDPEAEAKLWQDIERVMGSAAKVKSESPAIAVPATPATEEPPLEVSAKPLTEMLLAKAPKLNWQAKAKSAKNKNAQNVPQPSEPVSDSSVVTPQKADAKKVEAALVEASFIAATHQAPAAKAEVEVAFTEPSPWGKPLPEAAAANPATDYLPMMDAQMAGPAISPLVKPLRSQKKIGSLAAVQLPTFEKAKAGSFKR
jgi:hypothetical protein